MNFTKNLLNINGFFYYTASNANLTMNGAFNYLGQNMVIDINTTNPTENKIVVNVSSPSVDSYIYVELFAINQISTDYFEPEILYNISTQNRHIEYQSASLVSNMTLYGKVYDAATNAVYQGALEYKGGVMLLQYDSMIPMSQQPLSLKF